MTTVASAPASIVEAAQSGDLEAVRLASTQPGAAAAVDARKRTALHCAARRGDAEMTALLRAAGAPTTANDDFRRTPLAHALLGMVPGEETSRDTACARVVGRFDETVDALLAATSAKWLDEIELGDAAAYASPHVPRALLARGVRSKRAPAGLLRSTPDTAHVVERATLPIDRGFPPPTSVSERCPRVRHARRSPPARRSGCDR